MPFTRTQPLTLTNTMSVKWVFRELPELTALSWGRSWRKLFLSLMFLRSQSFTVWSTDAVANNQSQRELNSAWVTLALCSLSLKICDVKIEQLKPSPYKTRCNICFPNCKDVKNHQNSWKWSTPLVGGPLRTFWPSKLSSVSCPTLSPVTSICLLTDTSTQQNQ